jgi:hypothetical protein
MNVNEIFEANEIARIRAGKYGPSEAGMFGYTNGVEGSFPIYHAARMRYSPVHSGMTSQMNTAEEYLEYAITGGTKGFLATAAVDGSSPSNAFQGKYDISPMRAYNVQTTPTSAWTGTMTNTTADLAAMYNPMFMYEYGGYSNDYDTGNYGPMLPVIIPVRNNTDTDIVIPAAHAYFSGSSTYGMYGMSTITAAARNPTLTDTPIVTNLLLANGGNNHYTVTPTFTIPAHRSVTLVMWSHIYNTRAYSNSYTWGGIIGLHADLLYYLTNTEGLVPDYNAGIAILLGKVSFANSYAELFIPHSADTYLGAK